MSTSHQVGVAFGLAVLSVVSAAGATAAARGGEADAAAIPAGYRYAFAVGAGFAAAGLLAALFVLPRRGHRDSDVEERQE